MNELKIVILGEGRVGKTSILKRFFKDKFEDNQESTINPQMYSKIHQYQEKKVKFNTWDTAGQEIFNAITKVYYNNSVGAILVYDLTIHETFEKVKYWIDVLKDEIGDDALFVILGNKYDLCQKIDIENKTKEIEQFCENQNCKYFMVSAKTGYNIAESINYLFDIIINKAIKESQNRQPKKKSKTLQIVEQPIEKPTKRGCCS